MTQVYSVAVRHPNGSKNLYQIEFQKTISPLDLMEVVKTQLPESKVILCIVNPLVSNLKQVHQ